MATTQGKWVIKNLKIDQDNVPANISIPVTLSYKNANPVSFNVTKSALTVQTEWYTNIVDGQGVEISPNDIKITNGGSVTCGETKYQLTSASTWNWEIIPVGGGSSSSLTIRYTGSQVSALSGTTSAFSITAQNATVTGYTVNNGASITASGASSVTVSYPANQNGTQSKTYTVIVKGKDSNNNLVSGSTTFTQSADNNYTFALSPASTTVESTDTGKTFSVTATNITSVGYASSLSTGLTGGTANSTSATAKFSQNSSTSYVDKTFVITGKTETGRVVQAQASIRQNGTSTEPYLEISANPASGIPAASGTSTISISSNIENWTLSVSTSASGYASLDITSGSNDGTSILTFTKNQTTSIRNARVTVTGGGLTRYVDVKQNADSAGDHTLQFTNTSDLNAFVDVACSGLSGTHRVGITSDVEWTATASNTWIHVTTGAAYVNITVDNNDGNIGRNGSVTITAVDYPSLTLTIPVNQVDCTSPGEYILYFNSDYPALEQVDWDAGTRFYSIALSANVDWRIQSSESWMSIEEQDGTPITGGSGSRGSIYLSFSNNTGDSDRTLTITLSAADSSLGIPNDTITVTQTARINEFAHIMNDCGQSAKTTSYEEGMFGDGCFFISANTYWHLYSPELWIGFQPINGNSTHTEPGGRTAFRMSKTENMSVTSRTAVVQLCEGIDIGDHSSVFEDMVITQERGLSRIEISSLATQVPGSGATVTATIVSNQTWKVDSMENMTISGHAASDLFQSGTTELTFIVPANTGTTAITRTIVVKTIDPDEFVTSATLTFRQLQPAEQGTIKLSKDISEDPSGSSDITWKIPNNPPYHTSPPSAVACSGTSAWYFYVKTNATCYVKSITDWSDDPVSGVRVYDYNDVEITCGQTAGQTFGPTPNNSWARFYFTVGPNTNLGDLQGKKQFKIVFETLEGVWTIGNDRSILKFEQYGDQYYIEDPFWYIDPYDIYPTSYTLDSSAYIYRPDGSLDTSFQPMICLKATYYNASGTYSSEVEIGSNAQYGFLSGNCGLNDRISVTYPSWFYGKEPTYEEASGQSSWCPSAEKPYAFNIPANQGYENTGNTRSGDIVITYSYGGTNVPLTIHVEQPFEVIPAPEMSVYLWATDSRGDRVGDDNEATLTPSGSSKEFGFEILTASAASGSVMPSNTTNPEPQYYGGIQDYISGVTTPNYSPSTFDFSEAMGLYMSGGIAYPTGNGKGTYMFKSKGVDFDLHMICTDQRDSHIKKTIIIHVRH